MVIRETVKHDYKYTPPPVGDTRKPTRGEMYLGNPRIKRDGVITAFTLEQAQEYARCKNSCEYFAEKYCKVLHTDHGMVDLVPYPYQKKMWKNFEEHRFNIVLACRQSGKSIGAIAYLLWFAMFNQDLQPVLILANKGSTSKEMLSRITLMLENIPFYLQPGCKTVNKSTIEFSTNTKIEAHSTSSDSVRGKSSSLIYLDEFAFVKKAEEFYTSTYPVISSGKKSRVIITSTANGIGNLFYTLWSKAIAGQNEYFPSRVDWWDVPGRDEKWKAITIANTSPEQFDQEFNNEFGQGGSTLINGSTLLALSPDSPVQNDDSLKIYRRPEPGRKYVCTVDVGKGRGQDYSTFSIIDVSEVPFRQVAAYRNNTMSPLTFPDPLYRACKAYNDAYCVIESNDQGAMVYKIMRHDFEYDELFVGTVKSGRTLGLEMDKKVKRIGCSHLKDMVEQGKLVVVDKDTINELRVFEAKGTSYEAVDGHHDDMVMTLVIFSWFAGNSAFANVSTETLRSLMAEETARLLEASVPFFGSFAGDSEEKPVAEFSDISGRKDKFLIDDVFGLVLESDPSERITPYTF